MGVSVRQPRERQIEAVLGLTQRTLAKLGVNEISADQILVDDGYVGDGYGIPAASTLEAIKLAARLEGLLLDPVYTGRTMAGLIHFVRSGQIDAGAKVLFIHTGGGPALFAYQNKMAAEMDALTSL